MADPGALRLKSGAVSAPMLAEVFPQMESYLLSSSALAERRPFWIKKVRVLLDLSLAARGDRAIRLAGRHPGDRTTLFDLFTDGQNMCVLAPLQNALFEGEISGGVSPFGERYGVEPADLVAVFAIGPRLAASNPVFEPKTDTILATPSTGDSDGLKSVELDRQTGLPARATWRRPGRPAWSVDYLAWDVAPPDAATGRVHLMPSRLMIHHRSPRGTIDVTVRQFNAVNPPASAKRFDCPVAKPGTTLFPLSELGRALE